MHHGATARNQPVSLSLFASSPVSDLFAPRVRVACSLCEASASHPTEGGEELSNRDAELFLEICGLFPLEPCALALGEYVAALIICHRVLWNQKEVHSQKVAMVRVPL